MRHVGWLLAPLVALAWAGELGAQILLGPPPPGRIVVVSPGIGFDYPRRYPVPVGSVTIYVRRPVILVPAPPDDLSGVDLDRVPPPWRPPAGKPPAPQTALEELPPAQPGRAAPPPRPAPQPKEPPPKAPPPERKVPPLPGPPPPDPDPAVQAKHLSEAGVTAFADRAYGLAAQRFRQAAVTDHTSARARFLLAQALFALGKYREAVFAIQEGMDLQADWPTAPFRPRQELFKGHEGDLTAQLKALEEALAASPQNRFYLFLYAYQLWFDGRRDEAVPVFQRARTVTVDTSYIDRFLRAARGGEVAAR